MALRLSEAGLEWAAEASYSPRVDDTPRRVPTALQSELAVAPELLDREHVAIRENQ